MEVVGVSGGGEGEGLAHLHGGLVRSRATFSIVSVGGGGGREFQGFLDSSVETSLNE